MRRLLKSVAARELVRGSYVAVLGGVNERHGNADIQLRRLEDIQSAAGGGLVWLKFEDEPSFSIGADVRVMST